MDLMSLYNNVAEMRERHLKMVAEETKFMDELAVIIQQVQQAQAQEQVSEEVAE